MRGAPPQGGAPWFCQRVGLGLAGDYVGRTRAFFALSDLELNLLALLKIGVAGALDFRVMNEQIIAAIIGADKSKAFFPILTKVSFGLLNGHKLCLSDFFKRIFLRDVRICPTNTYCIIPGCRRGYNKNKK